MSSTRFKKYQTLRQLPAATVLSVPLFILIASCSSGSDFSGKNAVRQPRPSVNPLAGTSGGGGDGQGMTTGDFTTAEQARREVRQVKLSGSWAFDGCGDIEFNLTTGTVTVTNVGTPGFFRNNMRFDSTRADGSTVTTDMSSTSKIPDWDPVCVKTPVSTPTVSPGRAFQSVTVSGGQSGSRLVRFRFDDDGGDNTRCASRGQRLPGPVNVDGSTFSFDLAPCG